MQPLALRLLRRTLPVVVPLLLLFAACAEERAPSPDLDPQPRADRAPDTVSDAVSGSASASAAPETTATVQPGTGVDPSAFLNLEHPPLPDSLETRGGALAPAPGQDAADVRYAFDDVRDGTVRLLWLSELQGRDADGDATWRVVDVAEVPAVGAGERFLISGCRTPEGAAVAAVVQDADRETLTGVRRAWGVDRSAGRLATVDPAGIECENEGLRAP